MHSFLFQLEKKTRNSAFTLDGQQIHLQFCLGAMLTLLSSVMI